ncbi:MAG: peptidoglycan DD-metalloendopeptidase family protein [Bifidobacteriaceae bacterium]|jgi:murein DD-endopeptidase MepM/ murein hydrolase activator NlpD|nr:peptidoglycan DD-metalloendopeptidase family protein [Bifidobacteriaceae bacterium]
MGIARRVTGRAWGRRPSLRGWVAVAASAALVWAVALSGTPALAKKDRDELEREREANLTQIEEIGKQLEGVTDALRDAHLELERTKAELPVAEARRAEAEDVYVKAKREHEKVAEDLEEAETVEAEIQGEIAAAEERTVEAKQALGRVARITMMQDPLAQSDLMLLLGATSLEELDVSFIAADAVARSLAESLRVAQEDAATNRNREARLAAVREQIAALEADLAAALDVAETAKSEAEQAKAALQGLIARQEDQTRQLDAQKRAFEEQEKEARARQAIVESDLKKLAEAEKALAPDGGPPLAPGMFNQPLSHLTLTSPFGWRTHPILRTLRLHTGADFSAPCGTPIYATADGTVINTYFQSAWGNRTEVNHGVIGGRSVVSTYNHQMNGGFEVSAGQQVTKGQLIGYVGTTGWSTGCHLHFEIYEDGSPVNPVPYIS